MVSKRKTLLIFHHQNLFIVPVARYATVQNHFNQFDKTSCNDHFYQFSTNLNQWFQRICHLKLFLMDWHRTSGDHISYHVTWTDKALTIYYLPLKSIEILFKYFISVMWQKFSRKERQFIELCMNAFL